MNNLYLLFDIFIIDQTSSLFKLIPYPIGLVISIRLRLIKKDPLGGIDISMGS